jgi:hypothetical protein
VSGAGSPPPLGAGQVADLLDHVIYEQVLMCIDLDALYDLEQSLTMLAGCVARPETGLVADWLAVDRLAEAASLQIGWQ